jgi:exopolyphosphatase/guanosine-5'-triphosphate,3'-diphosphate pyrophosphatase
VIDLGSTAARFLVARVVPDVGYRVLYQERVPTRLGDGPPGALAAGAVRRTLRATRRFLRRLAREDGVPGPPPTRVVAVATAAVREARNRERLLGVLRRQEGLRVRVLSARQEARLGARAALHGLPLKHGVVVDLGGASLQVSRVRDHRVAGSASLPLGAVRLTRRFLAHDPPTPRELRALRSKIRDQLRAALPPAGRGDIMVGVGGTVRALAGIHLAARRSGKPRHGLRLQQCDVTAIREMLETLPRHGRARVRGLKADRVDFILAGAMVVEDAMIFGGYVTLVVSTNGVRDGLLLRETFGGRRAR